MLSFKLKKRWVNSMKRVLGLILSFILSVVLLAGCSNPDNSNMKKLERSDKKYNTKLDINSPEGLAQASSQLYKDLAEQKISCDDAFPLLESYSSKESKEALTKHKDDFKRSINEFIGYLNANDDSIVKFEFSKTVYDDSQNAHISRIQEHKSGKKFYFTQDFTVENGQWKIIGDNVEVPFILK